MTNGCSIKIATKLGFNYSRSSPRPPRCVAQACRSELLSLRRRTPMGRLPRSRLILSQPMRTGAAPWNHLAFFANSDGTHPLPFPLRQGLELPFASRAWPAKRAPMETHFTDMPKRQQQVGRQTGLFSAGE